MAIHIHERSRGGLVPRLMAGALLVLGGWLPGLAAPAADTGLTIATGMPGRAYHGVGERLREVGAGRGLAVSVVTTDGSLDNLRRLADDANPVNAALTQADALHAFIEETPGFGARVKLVESIGPECLFAVAAADGGIASFKDWWKAEAPRVALPAPDSGVAVTHGILAALIPALADDQAVYLGPEEAVRALHGSGDARVDVVFTVHRAKFRGPALKAALAEPERFRIIPIRDRRLQLKLPDGSPVYQRVDLPLVRGSVGGDRSVDTLCTKGLLAVNAVKLHPDARAKLQEIIDYDWMRVYPQPR